jgi:hypothetical protein
MMNMSNWIGFSQLSRFVLRGAPFALALFPVAAWAVDGVIEINQVRADAGAVTPGDTANFPVTIDQPGSYRLTGNLTVPDANTSAIEVEADNVRIDLNGFSILGPTVCGFSGCSPTGGGMGIEGSNVEGLSVSNGTIQGMGDTGIQLTVGSGSSRIERVRAVSNGRVGISPGSESLVTHCTANNNGLTGISVGGQSVVSHNIANDNQGTGVVSAGIRLGLGSIGIQNTAYRNDNDGIACSGRCTVLGNNVGNNSAFGLVLGSNSGYAQNVITVNTGGTVSGGIEIGENVCDTNTTCP